MLNKFERIMFRDFCREMAQSNIPNDLKLFCNDISEAFEFIDEIEKFSLKAKKEYDELLKDRDYWKAEAKLWEDRYEKLKAESEI